MSCVKIISVMACTFSTCMPLSPLRNSTMCDKMYTMRLLDFSRSYTWSATMPMSVRCFWYSMSVFMTRRRTMFTS